jgi:CheY-like chemotaxis protein
MNATEAIGPKPGQVKVQVSRLLVTEHTNLVNQGEGLSSAVLRPGVYVAISVQDSGVGMDKTLLERIFDPFFSTKGTGRGLGLSATLGIIRQHKGSLHVSSHLGQGSTFQVLLPATLPQVAPPAVDPSTEALLAPVTGTILVIEDEAIVRESLSEALRMIGLQVILAENGQQGLEAFRHQQAQISLVVLDMEMPVLNGADTLQALLRLNAKLGVILTSAYPDATLLALSTNQPTIVFLQKPYSIDHFIKTVKAQLKLQ